MQNYTAHPHPSNNPSENHATPLKAIYAVCEKRGSHSKMSCAFEFRRGILGRLGTCATIYCWFFHRTACLGKAVELTGGRSETRRRSPRLSVFVAYNVLRVQSCASPSAVKQPQVERENIPMAMHPHQWSMEQASSDAPPSESTPFTKRCASLDIVVAPMISRRVATSTRIETHTIHPLL